AELDQASFRSRVGALVSPWCHASAWATAALALMIACAIFYRFRQTPSVQAAELLRKAIAADGRARKLRPIQIRTRDRRLMRLSGAERKPGSSAADAQALDSIRAMFRSAHYDWEDPLSAKSYQAWRDQLADKRDLVIEEPGAYLIRTNTGSGELLVATLKIRMSDFQPVEERF